MLNLPIRMTCLAITLLGAPALAAQAVAPVAAPASPQLAAGMTVHDPAGGEVGSIESVSNDAVIVATGQHKVSLPPQSFAMSPKGPLIGMTRAELDAAAAKAADNAAEALRAQIVPGAGVKGVSGNSIGTIKAIDGEYVVLATGKGDARLPVNAFGSGPDGLKIGMSAAEFDAAVAGAR